MSKFLRIYYTYFLLEHITDELNKTKMEDSGAGVKLDKKRPRPGEGSDVEDTREIKKQCVGIKDLVFLFFTAASCGLCQGCDLCHPVECAPEKANAIEKDGMIYKQIGHGFDQAFASLTCLFIRMRASFKCYGTPTSKKLNHEGRLKVRITDDYGKPMETQALKFASLAWGQLTPAAKLATADMPLREFKRAYQVDHGDENKTNNNVSNGMIMTLPEHNAKTTRSAETIVKQAMSLSAPCTMTVFVSKGEPLLDSEGKPVVKNCDHRKKIMIEYELKSNQISKSIKREDMPTRNSLVKINYNGLACLAQFSWYNVPDLEGEIWKPITAADHKTLGADISEIFEYFVSNMGRYKFVVRSTQNERINDYRGKERPRITLMNKKPTFSRIVALVFHRKQMDKYILEQYVKTGIVWTFVKGDYQLEVDHIDFKSTNHCANNLQFLTPQENCERSNNRPCSIWEIGKDDVKIKHRSVTAAATVMGHKTTWTVHTILKNNTHPKWRGEYIVE